MIKVKKKKNTQKNNEIKNIILKSLSQNMQINLLYRNYARFLLDKKKNNYYRFKHLCLKNNRYSSINNTFYISKYVIKNYITNNKAQNCRINS
jgi:hypothetical protein